MTARAKPIRCAIYTRVSTDSGLDQEFNSLDAQYDAASAYIRSQAHARWTLVRTRYDDGGFSGGSTDRPALQRQKCSVRHVKMTVSLAFIAPGLVNAAVEGRLPRGIGVAALRDLPAEWSLQFARLGLALS